MSLLPLKEPISLFHVTPKPELTPLSVTLKRPEPFLEGSRGISLMVQWLRLCTLKARGPGFDPWSEN